MCHIFSGFENLDFRERKKLTLAWQFDTKKSSAWSCGNFWSDLRPYATDHKIAFGSMPRAAHRKFLVAGKLKLNCRQQTGLERNRESCCLLLGSFGEEHGSLAVDGALRARGVGRSGSERYFPTEISRKVAVPFVVRGLDVRSLRRKNQFGNRQFFQKRLSH